MSNIKKISGVVLIGAMLALVGCDNNDSTTTGGLGGGTTGGGTTGGTGNGTGTGGRTGGSSTSAHTIVLSYPETNAIENLGGGFYRRLAKAIVTDNEGNAVPDGTVVSFNVIDSIIATGTVTTAAGDSISGSVLTVAIPQRADGIDTNFVDASVYRNSSFHFIESGDHVFLFNADAADKNRVISTSTGSIATTTLAMTSAYNRSYPNAVYDSSEPAKTTGYVVGASLLGAEVSGLDADGTTLKTGYAVTKQGIATFYVTYPANTNTIGSGCFSEVVDSRSWPNGSADVYLVASAANNVTTIDNRFCFGSIADWTITPDITTISGTKIIKLLVEDGGDKINLPLVEVTATVSITKNAGVLVVDLNPNTAGIQGDVEFYSDLSGRLSSTITVSGGASGDAATITYRTEGGKASAKVELKIP